MTGVSLPFPMTPLEEAMKTVSSIGIVMLGMTDYAASPEAALGMVLTHNISHFYVRCFYRLGLC